MVDQVIGRATKSYAFRAFTRGNNSHLFVDFTETPQSIGWLMGHELTHQDIKQNPSLTQAFADSKPKNIDPAGDIFHEIDAEERFCDGISSRLLGCRFDRAWWRQQIARYFHRNHRQT
jgi:hypothetical protein